MPFQGVKQESLNATDMGNDVSSRWGTASMKLRILFIGSITVFLVCFLIEGATAQRTSNLNFISELEDYRTIRDMLPAYLSRLVAERLEERERTIAHVATPEEAARRRADVRARILQSVGGLPERTPLNARVVG